MHILLVLFFFSGDFAFCSKLWASLHSFYPEPNLRAHISFQMDLGH